MLGVNEDGYFDEFMFFIKIVQDKFDEMSKNYILVEQ